jgi:pSer/pThr/pTyr-binding forkhead associated (FHA) protein
LEKAILLIGRQSDCDVALTQSRKISRKHCCIAQVNNKFVVRDLGSTNGIFLNGMRIQKEATITIGDDLVIGDLHFRMQSETQLQSKKPPANSVNATKTIGESSNMKSSPPPIPIRNPNSFPTPPKRDMPIAKRNPNFDCDETSMSDREARKKNRIDDVIPLRSDEEEDDVIPLASDSF